MKKIFQIIIILLATSIIYSANNYSFAKNLDSQKVALSNKTNAKEVSKVIDNKTDKNNSKNNTKNSTNKTSPAKTTVSSQKSSNINTTSKNNKENNKESKKDSNKKENDYKKSTSKVTASQSNSSSNNSLQSNTTEIAEKEMTPSDWKISVDNNEKNEDFNSIHNSNPTENSLNDGHFLLILGIILVILSLIGLVIFSILLIKNKKAKTANN